MRGIIIIILLTILLVTISIGYETEIVGEKLCVDGHGDKNLEGIMCENTKTTFFGYSEYYGLIIVMITFLGILTTVKL